MCKFDYEKLVTAINNMSASELEDMIQFLHELKASRATGTGSAAFAEKPFPVPPRSNPPISK